MFAAMVKSGLTSKDLMEMDATKNKEDIVAFMNTVFAAGEMDQIQTPYYYDYTLHSVQPAPECIAQAELKPVPGMLEYATGSQDCFYRLHKIYSPEEKKTVDLWCR